MDTKSQQSRVWFWIWILVAFSLGTVVGTLGLVGLLIVIQAAISPAQ